MRALVACAALLIAAAPRNTMAKSPQEPRPCCMAMTAQCLACADGLTIREFCQKLPGTAGCNKHKMKSPRISYWSGKVNQHFADGEWKTDPDGRSGASIPKLTYCRKWWPDTASVKKLESKETITFYTAGNKDAYESSKDVFECVRQPHEPRSSSGDWCYDNARSSHSRCERLIAKGKCEWFAFDTAEPDFTCNRETNFIPFEFHPYEQKTHCGNLESVLKECRAECESREDCSAFFYQEHRNKRGCSTSPHGGYQICGYYKGKVDKSRAVKHNHHSESQVCYSMKATDEPTGKCIEVEDKKFVARTDEHCSEFCDKKGFGCLDYRKGANQMLSCAQACHMRVKLAQTQDQCEERCDRRGDSGCSLSVNGEVLSMCSRCEKHIFSRGNDKTCKFGVCSQDACRTGCGVTTAEDPKPEKQPPKRCRDDDDRAKAVCKGSCAELARNCGEKLGCGDAWSGDVAVFCPHTCGKCNEKDDNIDEPCMMIDCAPGFEPVGTDRRGCGGKCVKIKKDNDDDQPKDLPNGSCCEAMTVSCLACSLGLTEEEYCSKYPDKFDCSSSTDDKSALTGRDNLAGSRAASTASTGSTKGNGQANLDQTALGGSTDQVEESKSPLSTMCPPDKKGELTAEFILASLTGYLCGALSIWLYLKCSRKIVPTAPAAAIINTMQSGAITVVPVGGSRKAHLERAAERIPKPMFPPPPPPPRRSYLHTGTK